jgi:hypothetical protein
MADNYKILAQDTASSVEENSGENQANILYTVPENTQASVSSISLINTAEENVEYSLGVVKAEDAKSETLVEVVDSETKNVFLATTGFNFLTSDFNSSDYLYSNDAVSWAKRSFPSSKEWQSLTYGAGKFIAVSSGTGLGNNLLIYSADGLTWTQIELEDSSSWGNIIYANGKFVAVTFSSAVASSVDGVSWTYTYMGFSQLINLAYGDGKFVAASQSENVAAVSEDGMTWTLATSTNFPFAFKWTIDFGGGKFVLPHSYSLGYTNTSASYSTDGLVWEISNIPFAAPTSIFHMAYGSNKFLLLSGMIASGYAYSEDAITWTLATTPFAAESIDYVGDKFLLGGQGNQVAHSVDGLSWTTYSIEDGLQSISKIAGGQFNEGPIYTYFSKEISQSQTIIPTRFIEPNVVDEIVGGITLSEGDQIRIYSESPDLIAQVYGVEIE